MDTKSSLVIILVLIGAAAPIFLLSESQDCYHEKLDCEKDWGSSSCEENVPTTGNNCRYLGRSYYGYFSSGYHGNGGFHSVGSISRGGFGAIGHAMAHGGS